jgi:hypothetical protein
VPQVTTSRIRAIDRSWRTVINKYRGPIPVGLVVAHIVAESNGAATPIVRDAKRSIGMMKVPWRVGKKHGYSETDLEQPVVCLYVWCVQTNEDSARLHKEYPSAWTQANQDFWLSLRLIYILGFTNYNNLAAKAVNTANANALTAAIQTWIRRDMSATQRFGTFRARDLRRIADELDQFRKAIVLLDGPNRVSDRFSQAPWLSPGGEFETLRAVSA